VIGAGFGPLPSVTAVAIQNVVPRHQLGISVGTMNFSRNLYATILIAVFGAIVLGGTGTSLSGALAADAGAAAQAFRRVFFAAAASMSVALIALAIMEEKPLKADSEGE
jgi:sugar phosphate permease